VQICPITICQTSFKLDTAGDSGSIFNRQLKGFQFIEAQGFETGRGGSEIRAAAPDNMALNTF